MGTTTKSGRVTSDPLEPLPQPPPNRSVVAVERQSEAERSPESQSRISHDLKAGIWLSSGRSVPTRTRLREDLTR